MVFMFYYMWQLDIKRNLFYVKSGTVFNTISFVWLSGSLCNVWKVIQMFVFIQLFARSLQVFHWQQEIIWPIIIIMCRRIWQTSRAGTAVTLDVAVKCSYNSGELHVRLWYCGFDSTHAAKYRKTRTHSGRCVTWHPSSPGGQTLCTGPGSSWWGRHHASRASWRWQLPGAGKQPRVSPSMDLMAHLKWQNNEVCSKAIISLHFPVALC